MAGVDVDALFDAWERAWSGRNPVSASDLLAASRAAGISSPTTPPAPPPEPIP